MSLLGSFGCSVPTVMSSFTLTLSPLGFHTTRNGRRCRVSKCWLSRGSEFLSSYLFFQIWRIHQSFTTSELGKSNSDCVLSPGFSRAQLLSLRIQGTAELSVCGSHAFRMKTTLSVKDTWCWIVSQPAYHTVPAVKVTLYYYFLNGERMDIEIAIAIVMNMILLFAKDL